jgi:hypothetical protein
MCKCARQSFAANLTRRCTNARRADQRGDDDDDDDDDGDDDDDSSAAASSSTNCAIIARTAADNTWNCLVTVDTQVL